MIAARSATSQPTPRLAAAPSPSAACHRAVASSGQRPRHTLARRPSQPARASGGRRPGDAPASRTASSSQLREAVASKPVPDAIETDIEGSSSNLRPTYSDSPRNCSAAEPSAERNQGKRQVQYIDAKAQPVLWRRLSSSAGVVAGQGRRGRVSAHDTTSVSGRPPGPMAITECHWESRQMSVTPSSAPLKCSSSTQATRSAR